MRRVPLIALLALLCLSAAYAAEVSQSSIALGESVIIRTTPGATGLSLRSADQTYKYLGEIESSIAFKPWSQGEFIVSETLSDGTLVETSFTVTAVPAPATVPTIIPELEPVGDAKQTPADASLESLVPKQEFPISELRQGERQLHELTAVMRLRTSRGTGWVANIDAREGAMRLRGSTTDIGLDPVVMRKAQVTLDIQEHHVERIVLRGTDLSQGLDLGVDALDSGSVDGIPGKSWVATYAIDPTNVSFTDGTLTATAAGTELYKCRDWVFATRTCAGEWIKMMDLVPGQQYDVALSPADPGFAEAVTTTGSTPLSRSSISATLSLSSPLETVRTPWGVTVFNPTSSPISVSGITITANQAIFNTIAGIKPSSGWSTTTTTISWAGTQVIQPTNTTEFIFNISGQNQNLANALISLDVTTNASSLSNNGYITHVIRNNALPSPALYLVAGGTLRYNAEGVDDTTPSTYTVRVDNNAGVSTVPLRTALIIHFPPGWRNVSANAQSGWTVYSVNGDEGSGYLLMPQVSTTAIAAGSIRDFTFSAIPPQADAEVLHVLEMRLSGTSTSNTRDIASTLEPGIQANGTALLDYDDDRYAVTRSGTGSENVDQYFTVPAPFADNGANRWSIAIVNPTDGEINVTRIDWTADQNVFGAPTAITPASGWSGISASNIRWTGTVTIPPRDAAEFAANFIALGTTTTGTAVTITTVTTNGTLTTSGLRSSQSTGNVQFISMAWRNDTQTQIVTALAGVNNTFTIRLNNTGAGAAVPTNTMLVLRLPAGWRNITVPSQTGWTVLQVVDDPAGGSIRAITATSTIAAGATRDFNFNAIVSTPGRDSIERVDALFVGGTGVTNTQHIQSQAQLAVRVLAATQGINVTRTSSPVSSVGNVSALYIEDVVKATPAGIYNLSIYNAVTRRYEQLRQDVIGSEAGWNATLRINATFDPREFIERNASEPDHLRIKIKWLTAHSNQSTLYEDKLIFNTTLDGTPPLLSQVTASSSYANGSATLEYLASDDTGLRNCSLFINATFNQTNSTPNNATDSRFILSAADGTYNWSVQCVDLVGNANATGNRNITIDTTPPAITLLSPTDEVNKTDFTFIYSVTEPLLDSCSLFINGTLNQTNAGTDFVITINDGAYNWSVQCVDLAGNMMMSENRTVRVDATPPSLSNPVSTPANPTYGSQAIYEFNLTVTDANGISTVIFEENFTGTFVNHTVNRSVGGNYSHNYTPIAAGHYAWRMYANDSFSNWAASEQQAYTIAKAASVIALYLNGTQENYPVDINESVNITAILLSPTGYIELYVNGTLAASGDDRLQNISVFNRSGTFNISAVYNQTRNYSASLAWLLITVGDKLGPSINLTYLQNGSFASTSNVTFRFALADATGVANCTLYINGTANATRDDLVNSQENTINGTELIEGNYSYRISCYDPIGNRANSSTYLFGIDSTVPAAFSLLSPLNGTMSGNQSPTLSWTPSSDLHLTNYTIIIDNAIDFSSPNHLYGVQPGITSLPLPIDLTDGIWHWKAIAYDAAGNAREATQFVYTADTVPPLFTALAPANATYRNSTLLSIDYTVSDLTAIPNCTLRINDSTVYHNTSSEFIIAKGQGTYLWNVTCIDIAGNTNTTENLVFTIDVTSPTEISLSYPENNTFTTDNAPLLGWSQTVEQNFKNYTILVSDNALFTAINHSYGTYQIDNLSYQVTDPWADGTWYWKVIAWDLAGNSIDPFHVYTIDSTPPTAFTLLSPANHSASIGTTPLLSWQQSDDTNFKSYTILVSTQEDMSAVSFSHNISDNTITSWQAVTPWTDNTVWYWRVVASDTANNSRNSTDTFIYITDSGSPIVNTRTPSDGAVYSSDTSSLIDFVYNVSDLSDITTCTIIINDSQTVITRDSLFVSKDVDQAFTESLQNGDYNWSVNCTDEAGNIASSGRSALTVDVTLPRIRLYETSSHDIPEYGNGNLSAMLVYASTSLSGLNFPKYRVWNGSAWSAEAEIGDAGSPVRWVKMASSPVYGRAFEKIAVSVSDDGALDAYVWNGSAWSITANLASIGTTSNVDRAFDIEYETQRGRGMLVYSVDSASGAQDLAYRIWNGTGWTPEAFINDPSSAANIRVGYVRAARNPDNASNTLAIAYIDTTNSDGKAAVWNGSSWGSFVNITTAISITTEEAIGIAYEQQSTRILAVAGTGSTVAYASYNGSSWNQTGTVDVNPSATGTTNFLTLKANPAGDDILITGVDGGTDLSTARWIDGVWSGSLRHDAAVDSNAQRPADFEWEQDGTGVLVWGTASSQLSHRTYSTISGWGASSSFASGTTTHAWVMLRRVPTTGNDVRIIGAAELTNPTYALDVLRWDGGSFSTDAGLASSQSTVDYQRFDIAPDSYPPRTAVQRNITLNSTFSGEELATVSGNGLLLLTNATSLAVSNYSALGVYLPQGASVSFTSLFSAMNPGVSYITWQARIVNASGEHVICSSGNMTRTSSDTVIGSDKANATASCRSSANYHIKPTESIRVYTYVNSSVENTIVKFIDNQQTFIEMEGYALGDLTVAVVNPLVNPLIGEGENLTSLICQADCVNGFCLNTRVYAEINDSQTTYASIGYAENIILNSTTTNPAVIGTINDSQNGTFGLLGELYSNNTLRCVATSDMVNATSGILDVTVMDKLFPDITLIAPSDAAGFEPGNFTFAFNASDRRLGDCTLWGNWSGIWTMNQTITPENGTYTSFTPINISTYGTYKWNVNCSDLAGNDAYAASDFTFTIAGDVSIAAEDISFSPASPVEGANTTIHAVIRNNANRNETDVKVGFFLGDPLDDGVQLGSNLTIPKIEGLGSIEVNTSITSPIGSNEYFVLVDPAYGTGDIFEYNETNNLAGSTLFVSSWQIYYGNVSGNRTLTPYTNESFANWEFSNETGNIFIVDSDMTNGISFSLLKAMGRNTTGQRNADTDDDFAEMDDGLNTSSFPDGVNSSFTSSGDPVQASSFTIYSNTIADVPVVNSSDGNFTTGILWDSDDSSNSYYDGTDDEDIIFVTRIQRDVSAFGVQDYVIRVPSRLKDYKASTATVDIYYELQ